MARVFQTWTRGETVGSHFPFHPVMIDTLGEDSADFACLITLLHGTILPMFLLLGDPNHVACRRPSAQLFSG